MRRKFVATGLSRGSRSHPEHAAEAVKKALDCAAMGHANGVLLFLTPDYARHPEPALRAAARAAGCTQVVGCTGAGIFTEEEWVLDSPGAVAMVFCGHIRLMLPGSDNERGRPILSLCTPSGLTADWLDAAVPRIGAVSADLDGEGPFKVWSGSRVADSGCVEGVIDGVDGVIAASQGMRALTSPIEVVEVHGYDVLRLGQSSALHALTEALPLAVRKMKRLPLHLIMGGVTFGDPSTAIRDGRYRLNHIVSANLKEQSITLSHPLNRGERLFWAMRDALAAERDMRTMVTNTARTLGNEPDFALVFPCMGRGPNFFGNRDRDLELLTERFPELPFAGFYGNGEIGPLEDGNHLYQYSA
ncbi:MAG: FIST C-terminal domain-containing protein, partial [Acidiferrobacterales bacterium]